jgi:hypothetical protein
MTQEDGVLAVEMVDGSTGTFFVTKNVQYAAEVKIFKSTGTTDVTNVTVFY